MFEMRIYSDHTLLLQDINRQKNLLEEAKKLIDFGGDWDRRNRLKVIFVLNMTNNDVFYLYYFLHDICRSTRLCI